MSTRDWLKNSRGEWYVLAQTFLMALAFVAPRLDGASPSLGSSSGIAGTALCAAGFIFVVLGSVGLGRSLSPFPRPKESGRLVETGVFSLVRHPIYTGLSLLALGWTVLWMSAAALLATVALFALFDVKARREERWLQEKFDSYGAYKARVRKLVPFVY